MTGFVTVFFCPQSGASNFGEKFSRVKFSPSLTLFGGKPMEGWIAVTISGLVTVSLLKPNGQVLTSTESLCRLRCRVALADIAFTGGGNIVVATSDGSSASPVQFYKVCVSVVNEKCKIDTEILPSLFMRCTTDPARKDKYPAITHLKFLARDMSEQVRPVQQLFDCLRHRVSLPHPVQEVKATGLDGFYKETMKIRGGGQEVKENRKLPRRFPPTGLVATFSTPPSHVQGS